MSDPLRNLATNADLYAQKFDPLRDQMLLVPMTLGAYRAASFLDDRIIADKRPRHWIAASDIESAVGSTTSSRPVHFLFHVGHAGSTLLSRLIDDTGRVLGLREPLPLRTLAQMHDALQAPGSRVTSAQFQSRLDLFLKLWSRGYQETDAVLIKTTSSAARLATTLLCASPSSRCLYLSLAPETFLATMLSRSAAIADMKGFAPERLHRLARIIGDFGRPLSAMSLGELAAASWLAERLTQETTAEAAGERLLQIDFDDFLREPGASLAAVLAHLGISMSVDKVDRILQGPTMARYSKAPEEFAYSPQLRVEILAKSRDDNRAEIARGRTFLEILAARSPIVATVL